MRHRDARASRDTPEVGSRRPRRDRRDPRWCGGRVGRPHRPEPFKVSRWSRESRDADVVFGEFVSRWGVRCACCRREDLPAELLVGLAAHANVEQLSAILAARWCADGHLFDSEAGFTARMLAGRRWVWRPVSVCAMCGKVEGRRSAAVPVRDWRLLAASGVEEDVAKKIVSTVRTGPYTVRHRERPV